MESGDRAGHSHAVRRDGWFADEHGAGFFPGGCSDEENRSQRKSEHPEDDCTHDQNNFKQDGFHIWIFVFECLLNQYGLILYSFSRDGKQFFENFLESAK